MCMHTHVYKAKCLDIKTISNQKIGLLCVFIVKHKANVPWSPLYWSPGPNVPLCIGLRLTCNVTG